MKNKLIAFDIKIAKKIKSKEDFRKLGLGISCSATAVREQVGIKTAYYLGGPRIPTSEVICRKLVTTLQEFASSGYTIVTVNGLGFDFRILAEESGMVEECAELALNHHCDLMFVSVCALGWRVGLDILAVGAGVEGKKLVVTLNDGSELVGMDGLQAPKLWAAGEHNAVLDYLAQNVRATLEIAEVAIHPDCGYLRWVSGSEKPWQIHLPRGELPTVAKCLTWQLPDTDWMTAPPTRAELVAWMGIHAPKNMVQ